MKELSIEEKARRYDELKVKASRIYNKENDVLIMHTLEDLFPELKESEDERIRKEIISAVNIYCSEYSRGTKVREDMLAWLEKQVEKQTFWEKCNHCEYFDGYDICLHKKNFGSVTNESKENCRKNNFFIEKQGEEKPIKEHNICDICDFCEDRYGCVNPCPTKLIEEQNSAWSEEDELHIKELESLVKRVWAIAEHEGDEETIHKMSDLSFFLKTLKPQPKQEWSEDDEKILVGVITNYESGYLPSVEKRDEIIEKLKALKERYTWKPSDEQMDTLAKVCSTLHLTSGENEIMESLYDDLQKLK